MSVNTDPKLITHNLKRMMPAIVWVQFTALGFFFLCLAGVYWLDPTIWSLTKVEPFTALSKIVNPPLLSSLDALIGHRFHYSVIAAFLVGVLLIGISILIGAVVTKIRQLLKKEPLPLTEWMKDILLFEGIFLGVLAIGALFWTLFTSFDDTRDRDNSSYIFFALLPITAVLFLLGRFLSRKGYRFMGMSLLGLFGVGLFYGLGVSIYLFFKGELNTDYDYFDLLRRPSAQVVDESQYDGSYIGQERKTSSDTDTEDTYQREEVKAPEWDFVAFSKDSLQKLLNNEIYKKVDDLNEFFIKEDGYLYPMGIYAKGDTLSRKQPTLYHLQRYIGRDNNKLLAFWYHFGDSVMEAMYQSGQLGENTYMHRTLNGQIADLLNVYELQGENGQLYKDILDVMNRSSYIEDHIKGLKKVFKEYDIPEFERDLTDSNSPSDGYVRWVYTFWARRFDEGNTEAVLTILRSMQEQ